MTRFQYSSKECSVINLRPELGNVAKQHIQSGEKVLICCETTCEPKPDLLELVLGVDPFLLIGTLMSGVGPIRTWHSGYIITQNRLVIVSVEQGQRNASGHSISLADIVSVFDVQPHKDFTGQYKPQFTIVIQLPGGANARESCYFASEQIAQKFGSILRRGIDQAKNPRNMSSSAPSTQSLEDRLRTLTQLRDQGLISDVEFQQKRKEILQDL